VAGSFWVALLSWVQEIWQQMKKQQNRIIRKDCFEGVVIGSIEIHKNSQGQEREKMPEILSILSK